MQKSMMAAEKEHSNMTHDVIDLQGEYAPNSPLIPRSSLFMKFKTKTANYDKMLGKKHMSASGGSKTHMSVKTSQKSLQGGGGRLTEGGTESQHKMQGLKDSKIHNDSSSSQNDEIISDDEELQV